MNKSEFVLETETNEINWNFEIRTNDLLNDGP